MPRVGNRRRTVPDPRTEGRPDRRTEDAYRIRQRMMERRVQAGETILGKQIAVTSAAVMNMLSRSAR